MVAPPLITIPRGAEWLYVLAHGAGAGSAHPFLESMAEALAARQIATLRFDFPYLAAGRKLPDRAPKLIVALRDAWAEARATGLRLVVGGKSMGGRMSSLALAEAAEEGVEGCVFLGFPLHPEGKPGVERAEHLAQVRVPLLFLQGTRDALAPPALLGPIIDRLGATVAWVDGADHAFAVPRSRVDVHALLADTIARWLAAPDRSSANP